MKTLGFGNKCKPATEDGKKTWRKNCQSSASEEQSNKTAKQGQSNKTAKRGQPNQSAKQSHKSKQSQSPLTPGDTPQGISMSNYGETWSFSFHDENGKRANKEVVKGLEDGLFKYSELYDNGYHTRFFYIKKDGADIKCVRMERGSDDFKAAKAIVDKSYSEYN